MFSLDCQGLDIVPSRQSLRKEGSLSSFVANPASIQRIVADPQATASDLEWLLMASPLQAILHPNCPVHIWWSWAGTHPYECSQNPAFAMFLLEEPGRWEALERRKLGTWRDAYATRHYLSLGQLRLFAADCTEHAISLLPYFELRGPAADVLRNAVATARDYVAGTIGDHELVEVQRKAFQWSSRSGCEHAATAAGHACTLLFRTEFARYACEAAVHAAKATNSPDTNERAEAEKRWQWNRLQDYLQNGRNDG